MDQQVVKIFMVLDEACRTLYASQGHETGGLRICVDASYSLLA